MTVAKVDSTSKTIMTFLGEALHNPIATGISGLVLGFLVCWVVIARPLQGTVEAREQAVRQWEEINRTERQAIGDVKNISVEELRKWVVTLDEQNTYYIQLITALHKWELDLAGPAYTYPLIALVGFLGTLGIAAWLRHDGDADAARTLENAAVVLPSLRRAVLSSMNQPALTARDGASDRHEEDGTPGTAADDSRTR